MSTFVPSNWIIPRIYLNLKKRPTFFPQPSVRTLGKTNANSVPSCSGPLCGEQARMPPNGARRVINAGRTCPTASLQYPHDYFSLWTFFVFLPHRFLISAVYGERTASRQADLCLPAREDIGRRAQDPGSTGPDRPSGGLRHQREPHLRFCRTEAVQRTGHLQPLSGRR